MGVSSRHAACATELWLLISGAAEFRSSNYVAVGGGQALALGDDFNWDRGLIALPLRSSGFREAGWVLVHAAMRREVRVDADVGVVLG